MATPQDSSTTITRYIDLATVGLIALVCLMAMFGASTAGIAVGTLLPPPIGIIGLGFALVTMIQRKAFNAIDLALVGFIALVFGLVAAGMPLAAIGLGALIPPIAGCILGVVAIANAIAKRGTGDGESDFSSLDHDDELAMVPQERSMRALSKKAMMAAVIVCGVFVLAGVAIATSYSPCTKYCDKPPSNCKEASERENFKRVCDDSCAALVEAHGKDFVETLTGCSFANSTAGGCEEPTKAATEKGLWCKEKD